MKNVYSGTNYFNKMNRNKKVFFIKQLLLFLVLIGILPVVLHGISVAGKSIGFTGRQNITSQQNFTGQQKPSKYYTSVTIRPGDTLWSIAEEYMPEEYTDTKEYIEEIMELNHLHSYKIHSGGALVVPYY
ncbi:MAG: LysM peptidoglycan-binding domain-containing protein [Eubacterium sp.]|nr:LysM peptidoglycan-binding domain-containing protein [Eubacterium sp.]